MKKELRIYCSKSGKEPFAEWLTSLKDVIGRANIMNHLNRVVFGNYGDCDPVGNGVRELRVHYGPGYRIYFAEQEETILLLCGGNKQTQNKDIKKAKLYLADFRERCYD